MTRIEFFMGSGALWLGLYAAFGQPILILVGGLCLAVVGYDSLREWWASRGGRPRDRRGRFVRAAR